MTSVLVLAARLARGLQIRWPSQKQRAQGKPGADCTRGLVCQTHSNRRTRAYRFSRNSPAFPTQWFYGLLRALPGERAFLPPSLRGIFPAQLSASIAAPGPHDFAVRLGVFVRCEKIHLTPKRPPHPAPTCRDDHDTPLLWARDGRSYN